MGQLTEREWAGLIRGVKTEKIKVEDVRKKLGELEYLMIEAALAVDGGGDVGNYDMSYCDLADRKKGKIVWVLADGVG